MPLYSYKVKNEAGKLFTGEAKWTARRNFGDCFWTRDTPGRIVEKNVITI